MRATADVSALKQEIIAGSLRRVAILQPLVAMVMAEALAAVDAELAVLVGQIDVADAEFASRVLAGVISEGRRSRCCRHEEKPEDRHDEAGAEGTEAH
jgi:hypothetical protein